MAVLVTFALILLWERPRLRAWPARERAAFWVAWGLALAWSVALLWHLPLPNPTRWALRLFAGSARRYLTPGPDIFW